jgi:hypothetical protein
LSCVFTGIASNEQCQVNNIELGRILGEKFVPYIKLLFRILPGDTAETTKT